MTDKFSVMDDIDSFVEEARDDYVGLWQIVHRAKKRATDENDVKAVTLAVIKGLLDRGLAAGNLTQEGGFQPWSGQDLKAVSNRIQQEWQDLGRNPTVDDIAWFQLPR